MAEFTPALGVTIGVCQVLIQPWQVLVDGASNIKGAGVKILIKSPKGLRLEKSLRLGFQAFNNEAEYEALIARLRAAQTLGAKEVEIFSDSRLVVSHVKGSMSQYLKFFETLQACF